MTNTTDTKFTFEMHVEMVLQIARTLADKEITEFRTALGADPGGAVQWCGEKMIRSAYRLRVLSIAEAKGAEAMTIALACTLGDGSRSTSLFANAVSDAEMVEARSLINEFSQWLDGAALMRRM